MEKKAVVNSLNKLQSLGPANLSLRSVLVVMWLASLPTHHRHTHNQQGLKTADVWLNCVRVSLCVRMSVSDNEWKLLRPSTAGRRLRGYQMSAQCLLLTHRTTFFHLDLCVFVIIAVVVVCACRWCCVLLADTKLAVYGGGAAVSALIS